jgi:osmotically inducible lipoprotein OsmB
MNLVKVTMIIAIITTLAACGESRGDRAISGGAIGAGVGAAGAAVLNQDPITGALIGGAVGAGAGALTKEKDVNLGKPIWK